MDEAHSRWIIQNDEVLYAPAGFNALAPADIGELKQRAAQTPRQRCRVCLHDAPDAVLHDMVIVQGRGIYARPHRHLTRPETIIVLEGEGTFIRFSNDGKPVAAISLSASSRVANAVWSQGWPSVVLAWVSVPLFPIALLSPSNHFQIGSLGFRTGLSGAMSQIVENAEYRWNE